MILATPLSDANGYLVISNLFTYARTWVGGDLCHTCCLCQNLLISFTVFLGLGLLAAPRLKSFRSDGRQWRPRGSRLGLKTIVPLTLLFVLVNEGFCEDLARQTTVTHLSQLHLGSGVITCGLCAITYGLRSITWVMCFHIWACAITYGSRVITLGYVLSHTGLQSPL
jgi:hypothetical protein